MPPHERERLRDELILDPDAKTMLTAGDPKEFRDGCPNPTVRNFLTRGEAASAGK